MNQCMANRSCHASMLGRQLVERRNGGRVAQHYGDLPALVAQGCLTLSAGLWTRHGSALLVRGVVAANGSGSALGHLTGRPAGERLPADTDVKRTVCFLGDRDRGSDLAEILNRMGLHGRSPSGLIPPMDESYAVTSDMSTPSGKDFFEAA